MQQSYPAFMQAQTQLQQASIVAQQFLSPLVHVKQTPFWVAVQLQSHMHKLHWQATMPLAVQEKPSLPPDSALQASCKAAAHCSSSQVQVIFMPFWHFSTLIVHCGTAPNPGLLRVWPHVSLIVALDMTTLLIG